jgi:hypothetical protein
MYTIKLEGEIPELTIEIQDALGRSTRYLFGGAYGEIEAYRDEDGSLRITVTAKQDMIAQSYRNQK